ncbi:unnamed protein product [Didymodactylos carnosus]|uniref:MATH domain-containing protein n=1 Tax=Didymodactylos carnosus TaxID=1234261 RepID=A0A815E1F4_9BILA|nr:unnamed protein product [Didymodactylos carnosus]CAF4137043.1 unnamed protein product [Didymodactylos carnosus]
MQWAEPDLITTSSVLKFEAGQDLKADKAFKREIDQLHVQCIEHINNCHWNGTIKDYQVVRSQLETHYLTATHQQILILLLLKFQDLTRLWTKDTTTTSNIDNRSQDSDLASHASVNELYSELQKAYETSTVLTKGTHTLMLDMERISSESLRNNTLIQSLYNEISQVKMSIAEGDSNYAAIGAKQETIQQELSSLKEKVDDIEMTSFDGTLIWKVTDVANKMADAQSERQTSIYSPVFYSSPVGYKMRVRLYPYGDGNARRTHMSLFFVLVRGEYDAVLIWPFSRKVTFCLFDQSGQNRHVIDSFKPDVKSNSFKRPQSEMNIASGIPKFFPLPMIQQDGNNYVKDDTMFIKVVVDFNDMPKMILPYTLGLNPGLPPHVQHYLIQQEIQKRLQAASTSATSNVGTCN